MSFADEYVAQMEKSASEFHDRVFPEEAMGRFEQSSSQDIAAGRNVCQLHTDRRTFERLYPEGVWLCSECAQIMFNGGLLVGRVVFDMRKE